MDRNAAFGGTSADDLPRTLRREREARERAQQSTLPPPPANHAPSSFASEPLWAEGGVAGGTTVTDIRIPFSRLVMFGFKAVFAFIPALLVLGAVMWLVGHLLMTYLPWLVKVQILIRVP